MSLERNPAHYFVLEVARVDGTAATRTPVTDSAKQSRLDTVLTIAAWLLAIAILAFGAYFAYSVYVVRQQANLSSPAMRTVEALREQVRDDPNDAFRRVRLAEGLGAAGLFEEALEQLQFAIELDPEHSGAYLDIGFIGMLTQDYTMAEQAFLKVLELTAGGDYEQINERREQALFYLGEIALIDQRYEDAIGYFKASLRIKRDASDTYLRLAQAYIGIEEWDQAEEYLIIAREFDRGYPEVYYEWGRIHEHRGDIVQAATAYRFAVDRSESDIPKEALAALGTWEEWFAKAQAALDSGDREAAYEAVQIAEQLDPMEPEAHLLHSKMLEDDANPEEALKVLREAREYLPNDSGITSEFERLREIVRGGGE